MPLTGLDQQLKQACKDLSEICEEVVIIVKLKQDPKNPKVVILGAYPECLKLTEHATKRIQSKL